MRTFKNIDTGNVFNVSEEEGERISRLAYMQEGYTDNNGGFHAVAKSIDGELRTNTRNRDEEIGILDSETRKYVEAIRRLNENKLSAIKKGDNVRVKAIEKDIAITQEKLIVADKRKRAVK